jgi:uncharacterized protein (DUF1800 family)
MSKFNPYSAYTRFGNGASPNLAKLSEVNGQTWLLSQLVQYEIESPKLNSEQALKNIFLYRAERIRLEKLNATGPTDIDSMARDKADQKLKDMRKAMFGSTLALTEQIILQSIQTDQPLQARLLDFFSNHFSVSASNLNMRVIAPTLEVEAIAPHLHGYFSDMLVSVTQHPAMIYYLNNENSIGPNSKIGLRQKQRGLNENLGREILELHTLGVNAGYLQKDVEALSKGLTGWSIGGKNKNQTVGFMFKPNAHEPAEKTLLGIKYPEANSKSPQQAIDMLRNLAQHEKTASHLSYKLAKHFIADQPPKKLVQAMTASWIRSKGHIPSVMKVLIEHPESWSTCAQKFKTPREYLVSVCRACQLNRTKPGLIKTLEILGQTPYSSGSPSGFSDSANDWASASSILNRIEWAEHIAEQVKGSPTEVAKIALGHLLHADTEKKIAQAESKRQGLAMLFMSPEFLRR